MALLVVMLLLALMASLAVNTNQFWQSAFDHSFTQQSRIEVKWRLLGAEAVAYQRLIESLKNESTVNFSQGWAQSEQAFNTEESYISIAFYDAETCFNINSLNYRIAPPKNAANMSASPSKKDTVVSVDIVRQVFDALLANQGFNEAEIKQIGSVIAARLVPGMKVFSDISELRQITGLNRERFLHLTSLLCALPVRAPNININVLNDAHWPLLQALFLNKATSASIQKLLAARPVAGWKSISDANLQKALQELKLPPLAGKPLLSVRSRYFYAHLTIENEESKGQLQSLLRYERKKITLLDRQISYGGKE